MPGEPGYGTPEAAAAARYCFGRCLCLSCLVACRVAAEDLGLPGLICRGGEEAGALGGVRALRPAGAAVPGERGLAPVAAGLAHAAGATPVAAARTAAGPLGAASIRRVRGAPCPARRGWLNRSAVQVRRSVNQAAHSRQEPG
jgi:hypothetical protein